VKLLAIETSTIAGGAALLDGEQLVGEQSLNVRLTHSERLMVAVDRLLGDLGWRPADLEALAVSIGPGSFTGLRIGVSAAKGLALALSLPIAAVPTLDALAAGLPFAALPVCPVLDARKGEVYAGLYRWSGNQMRREWGPLALAPAELARRLVEPAILCGDGVAAVDCPLARLAPPARRLPSAACVGQVGLAMVRAGQVVGAAELEPVYLRPSEAELRRRHAPVLA
jgi:tRNA threonylcarbamoyladenosine biosynthesis protein TsaB